MTESSSSDFIVPDQYSTTWHDVMLVQQRKHTLVYTASRYGRLFVLKTLPPNEAELTDYRLQQEQEFQLGVQLVHPNIAATYSLEDVPNVGRCIVQEWIDGITLGEWLRTKPSRKARKRVFYQLLDALEYLHGQQCVHHDIKSDNIMVTRNGINVKLIDFGLSATDATLSPLPNDQRSDIQSIGKLMPELLPCQGIVAMRCRKGQYANIASLRRALERRSRFLLATAWIVSILFVAVLCVLIYVAREEQDAAKQRVGEMLAVVDSLTTEQVAAQRRVSTMQQVIDTLSQEHAYSQQQASTMQHRVDSIEKLRMAEQRRYDEMQALVDKNIAEERRQVMEMVNRPVSFDHTKTEEKLAHAQYLQEYTRLREHWWKVRDSLLMRYKESDPLRLQFMQQWTIKEDAMHNELYPQLFQKRY